MKFRTYSFASFSLLALALVPLLSACPSSEEGDDEVAETGTEESGSETQGTESGSETQGSETTANETSSTDTGTDTTDTGTTGDPLTEELCTQACAVVIDCMGDIPNCVEECIAQHEALDAECLGFEQALTSCIAGLTCDELNQFFESSPEPYPCQAEEAQVCDSPACSVSVGMGQNPEDCSIEYMCPDQPTYAVDCNVDGCTCLVDGAEVGGCSNALDVCGSDGDVGPINDCCGFDL